MQTHEVVLPLEWRVKQTVAESVSLHVILYQLVGIWYDSKEVISAQSAPKRDNTNTETIKVYPLCQKWVSNPLFLCRSCRELCDMDRATTPSGKKIFSMNV
jgi:hypothetical protein